MRKKAIGFRLKAIGEDRDGRWRQRSGEAGDSEVERIVRALPLLLASLLFFHSMGLEEANVVEMDNDHKESVEVSKN